MTTIIFPILTFSVVFLIGLIFGILISLNYQKKIIKNIESFFTYEDENGNIVKYTAQDTTFNFEQKTLEKIKGSKIKLNKYEMEYLIRNIQMHLDNIGETTEENEFVKDLYENLKTKKNVKN